MDLRNLEAGRVLSRRSFVVGTAAGTAGVLLAACGGSSSNTPTTASSGSAATQAPTTSPTRPSTQLQTSSGTPAASAATPAASPAATTASTAPKQQTPVVIAQGTDATTLDPQYAESGSLANILNFMFDYLISYDRSMQIVPHLAESYELKDDKVTWQFKLRKGIKFWNGEPFDSKSVKFTIDRIGNADLRKQGLNDPYYGRVSFDHLDVVDDYTVNFVTKEPTVLFTVYTTFPPMLAPGYYSQNPPATTAIKPMGTGPWMFKEWIKDDHLTMVANPDYYRGKPEIETVIYKPVPEGATRVAMLERGEADVIADATPDDLKRIESNSKLRVSKAVGGRRVQISIPTQTAMFKDKRVRQAMNYAVDFDAINKSLLGGVAYGRMATPVNGDFWIDPSIKPYAYDPEKAKSLLKDAGWDANQQVTINTPVGRYLKDKEIAEAVAGMYQKIGMKAQVQTFEYTVYSDKLRKSELDQPYLVGYGSRFYGPDDVSILFEKGFEGFEWVDLTEGGKQAKPLYEKLKGTFDTKEQQQLVYQISKIFVDEAPWVFLWNQVALFGVNKRIDWEGSGNTRLCFWLANDKQARFT